VRHIVPLLLTFTGCAENDAPETSDHTLGELEAFLEAAQMLVEGHGSAAAAASSLDEMQGAEAGYLATWALLGSEMSAVVDEIEACDKDPGAESHLDATRAAIADMESEMDAHEGQHEACVTVAECVANEPGHGAIMGGDIDTCLEHHEEMHDQVACGSTDDDMGHMGM
jgi:hypothetical protein